MVIILEFTYQREVSHNLSRFDHVSAKRTDVDSLHSPLFPPSRAAKLPQMEDFGFGSPALVLTFLRILFTFLIKISIKTTSAASAIDTTADIDSE